MTVVGEAKAPFISLDLAEPAIEVERRGDGSILLTSPYPLGACVDQVNVWLRRWGRATPERCFLAERERPGGDWRRLTYADAVAHTDALAQALLDRGIGPGRPVLILSGNGIDHALLTLAAMQVGAPAVPVSVAYSLRSADFATLRFIAELVGPALVYAADAGAYGAAMAAICRPGMVMAAGAGRSQAVATIAFADLLATRPTAAVEAAFAAVQPDSTAKILFTSGSTGMPKGVINTQRMLCVNQQMVAELVHYYRDEPPVLVDWLPWSHTYGGNHNLNMVLHYGGTLYIDGGRPLPGMFDETIRNLREISPTNYYNVPAGYAMLVPELDRDPALRRSFFRNLKSIFYGGAAMSQDLWDRLEALSVAETGRRVLIGSGWGSTETAPVATTVHWPIERAGCIGLPLPGVAIKMVPNGAKMELRVKGENVTPGYFKRPDLTAEAFDEEGFYRIGDAARFMDPDDPTQGLAFDGRVAENFKLVTGTWVHAGMLRIAALEAAAPALQDAVVAGHDRSFVALLAWPSLAGCRSLCDGTDLADAELFRHPAVIAHLRTAITAYNDRNPGSSTRIGRLLLMAEPPSIDANEITDKGYINQAATLANRAGLVEMLYADPPPDSVIEF